MEKNDLFIVGAGGFAREIYSYLSEMNYIYDGYSFKGFLDDNPLSLSGFNVEHNVISSIKSTSISPNSVLIMGVADCKLKQNIFDFYSRNNIKFLTFRHQTSVIGRNVCIGDGCVFAPYSVVTSDVKLGHCCTINALSTIGHDVTIGNFCTLSGHCDVTGGVKLGNQVFLGSHACVLPKVVVESQSRVGAGSVVIKKVLSGSTVFGNPAKKIM